MYQVALLLPTLFAAFALAAPVADDSLKVMGTSMQYGTGGGILGFIVLVLDILVWIEVIKSSRPPSHKLLWCVLVFIFPIIGVVAYYFLSDRKKWNSGVGGYEVLP